MHFSIEKLASIYFDTPNTHFAITRFSPAHYTISCQVNGIDMFLTSKKNKPMVFSSLITAETYLYSYFDGIYCFLDNTETEVAAL